MVTLIKYWGQGKGCEINSISVVHFLEATAKIYIYHRFIIVNLSCVNSLTALYRFNEEFLYGALLIWTFQINKPSTLKSGLAISLKARIFRFEKNLSPSIFKCNISYLGISSWLIGSDHPWKLFSLQKMQSCRPSFCHLQIFLKPRQLSPTLRTK